LPRRQKVVDSRIDISYTLEHSIKALRMFKRKQYVERAQERAKRALEHAL
jgi:hypothetical protein